MRVDRFRARLDNVRPHQKRTSACCSDPEAQVIHPAARSHHLQHRARVANGDAQGAIEPNSRVIVRCDDARAFAKGALERRHRACDEASR
jgi:hypothetical protein